MPGNIPAKLPSLSSFLEGDPPVSTSLDDALTEISFLDDYEPSQILPLLTLPQDNQGRFRLIPGAFAYQAQSYCLKAGAHGPGGGDGYLYAPLAGPKGTIVRHILQNSVAHPEIPQQKIQVLLWAIIARTKISDTGPEVQHTAAQLLTRKELRDLDGGALGLVPDSVMREAMGRLPPAARQVFEAEARLRSMLTQANAPYAELERVAVLVGDPPFGEDSRLVPTSRWSYHPDGYFIRFLPSGYSQTLVQVVVPAPVSIERDAEGRVSLIADRLGNRIEAMYEESGASIPDDPGVRALAFRGLRLVHPASPDPDTAWEKTGWTLVGSPEAKGHPERDPRFGGLPLRYLGAQQHKENLEQLAKHLRGTSSKKDSFDFRTLVELAQLRAALQSILASSSQEAPAAQTSLELVTQAWLYVLCREAGGCAASPVARESNRAAVRLLLAYLLAPVLNLAPLGAAQQEEPGAGGPTFDPSGNVGVPGNRSRQRLGQSARCTGDECQPCKGDEAKKRNPGGNALGPGDPIYDGMVDGARAAGITGFGPEHIGVQDLREKDGILQWQIRLDAQGCPLPTGDCVLWAGENGYLPEGKQEGAKEMVFGAIQFAGNSVRVNGRFVSVETGVISKSAKATTTGTGREAVARAMADMLRELGLRCQKARGLNF
ncbi:MAG: hypothetical protein HY656_04610 [Acidobacteria bacterium]|nr:hypothetical protein [Acidobacteriota bacterium]